MKEVMISIQPKWVEKIASGEKTIEVRKIRPKLETPFKCYIYETQGEYKTGTGIFAYGIELKGTKKGKGKVIGEFVCDDIDTIRIFSNILYCVNNSQANKLGQMCLTIEEVKSYLGEKNGYNWHISDLKIYDKPKELSEFKTVKLTERQIGFNRYETKSITRPPQSWCYVEENEDERT